MVTMRLALLVILISLAGCQDSDSSDESTLTLTFTGLNRLPNDYLFEGWIVVDGTSQSIGKFNVSESDSSILEDSSGNAIANSQFSLDVPTTSATSFFVSVETPDDASDDPSETRIMAGSFVDGVASMGVGHETSIGTDFSDAAGQLILSTPTTLDNPDDDFSGVWWIDPSSGEQQAGLTLPPLPEGWLYEGWTEVDGVVVSTGKFGDPEAKDLLSQYGADEEAEPNFPGEDLLNDPPEGLSFPIDLSDAMFVISVEPDPDPSSDPFPIKPLVLNLGDEDGVVAGQPYAMDQQGEQAGLPTGKANLD